jgi:hypothetical protein
MLPPLRLRISFILFLEKLDVRQKKTSGTQSTFVFMNTKYMNQNCYKNKLWPDTEMLILGESVSQLKHTPSNWTNELGKFDKLWVRFG